MMKFTTALLTLVMILTLAGATFAAETNLNLERYNAESKNPWLAVGAAWLLPSLGHAYAGDWVRCWPFVAGEVAGLAIALQGMNTNTGGTASSVSSTGLVIFIAARIWEYVDAFYTAEDANKKLKEKYNLTFDIREKCPVLAFNYNF